MIKVSRNGCYFVGKTPTLMAEITLILIKYMTMLHEGGVPIEKIRDSLIVIETSATECFLESIGEGENKDA